MPEVMDPPAWPCAPGQVHRITHAQFHALDLPKGVVLKRGVLVRKMTKGVRHVIVGERLGDLLRGLSLPGYFVREQNPVAFHDGPGGDSEPEPDALLIRGAREDFGVGHPPASAVVLLVEVADSSLKDDREFLFDCAWFAVPRVWLVNLTNDTVEVYGNPVGAGTRRAKYETHLVFGPGNGHMLDVHDGDRFLGRLSVDALLA